MQDTEIKAWGNSWGVTLSKPFSIANDWNLKTKVSVDYRPNEIVIKKTKPKYTMAELLKGMTKDNVHEPFDWGPDVGREIVEY